MKLEKLANIVTAFAEALQSSGDNEGAQQMIALSKALKKNGRLEVKFLASALSSRK